MLHGLMLGSLARFSVGRELPTMKNTNQTTPTQPNIVNSSETPHVGRPAAPPEPSTKPNQATKQQFGVIANNKLQGKYYPCLIGNCMGTRYPQQVSGTDMAHYAPPSSCT